VVECFGVACRWSKDGSAMVCAGSAMVCGSSMVVQWFVKEKLKLEK
jgi:hypothetical protein